jgi:putative transposase
VKYILNQEEHHKKVTFREEYLAFLRKFEIEYDEKYLFEFYDL